MKKIALITAALLVSVQAHAFETSNDIGEQYYHRQMIEQQRQQLEIQKQMLEQQQRNETRRIFESNRNRDLYNNN